MNELVAFFQMMADAGWLVLCALFVVALGLFLVDRRTYVPAAEGERASGEGHATTDKTAARERRAA